MFGAPLSSWVPRPVSTGDHMPFKKITSGPNKGKYKSESGKLFTEAQMKAYYATDGFKRKPKKKAIKKRRK
jgi:hypothetical protein